VPVRVIERWPHRLAGVDLMSTLSRSKSITVIPQGRRPPGRWPLDGPSSFAPFNALKHAYVAEKPWVNKKTPKRPTCDTAIDHQSQPDDDKAQRRHAAHVLCRRYRRSFVCPRQRTLSRSMKLDKTEIARRQLALPSRSFSTMQIPYLFIHLRALARRLRNT